MRRCYEHQRVPSRNKSLVWTASHELIRSDSLSSYLMSCYAMLCYPLLCLTLLTWFAVDGAALVMMAVQCTSRCK